MLQEGHNFSKLLALILATSLGIKTHHYNPHEASSKEACKYLKISKKTLDNLCDLKELGYYKPKGLRYFMKEDLDVYIQRNRHRAKYSNYKINSFAL